MSSKLLFFLLCIVALHSDHQHWLDTLKYWLSCRLLVTQLSRLPLRPARQNNTANSGLMLLYKCLTAWCVDTAAESSRQPSELRPETGFWCFFVVIFVLVLHLKAHCLCVCVHVSVLFYSVWDALTDNYISTWDGTDSEGLNGNLSDQEVHVLYVCICRSESCEISGEEHILKSLRWLITASDFWGQL